MGTLGCRRPAIRSQTCEHWRAPKDRSHRAAAMRVDSVLIVGQSVLMPGDLQVVLVSAVSTGQGLVAVRCVSGEVRTGDQVLRAAPASEEPSSAHAEVTSILRFDVPMTDEDLRRAGWALNAWKDFGHSQSDVLRDGETALVLLTGAIFNALDGARLTSLPR